MNNNLKHVEFDEKTINKTGSYTKSTDLDREKIQTKINEGHKIIWSPNGKWCEIDGETFNVSKNKFTLWVGKGLITLPVSYVL